MTAESDTALVSVREAVFDLLRGLKMTTVFGNPGSTELPFLDRWPDDFRYVLGLQEASVVGMADGYARATGRAAFCNLHSAAGVGHALGNIYNAYRNQTPLVISAGQQSRSLLPMNPFLGASEAAIVPQALCEVELRARARRRRAGSARACLSRGDAAAVRADVRVDPVRRLAGEDAARAGAHGQQRHRARSESAGCVGASAERARGGR